MIASALPLEPGQQAMCAAPMAGLPNATIFSLPPQPARSVPVEQAPEPGDMLSSEVVRNVTEQPAFVHNLPSCAKLAAAKGTIGLIAPADPNVSTISVDGVAHPKSCRTARPAGVTDKPAACDATIAVFVVPVLPPSLPGRVGPALMTATAPIEPAGAGRDQSLSSAVVVPSPATGPDADARWQVEPTAVELSSHAIAAAKVPPAPVRPLEFRLIASAEMGVPSPQKQSIVAQSPLPVPLPAPIPSTDEPPAAPFLAPTAVRAGAAMPTRTGTSAASPSISSPRVGSRQREEAIGPRSPPPLRDGLQPPPPAPGPTAAYRPEPPANSGQRAIAAAAPPTPPASVAVDTPSLGAVAAEVTRRDRHNGELLHVHFAVDRSQTAALIAGAGDDLGRALAATGSRLDALTVEVRGGASDVLAHRSDPAGGDAGRSGDDARRQARAPRPSVAPLPRPTSTKPVARDRFA